jgi:hypothetical protein
LPSPFELASLPLATRFDFSLGSENGAFAYNARRFTENHHLGRVREKTNGWLDPSALIKPTGARLQMASGAANHDGGRGAKNSLGFVLEQHLPDSRHL